jgi:hypothetical protein
LSIALSVSVSRSYDADKVEKRLAVAKLEAGNKTEAVVLSMLWSGGVWIEAVGWVGAFGLNLPSVAELVTWSALRC